MLNYVIRRLLLMIPTLIGMTIVAFSVIALQPGGIGGSFQAQMENLKPETRKALEDYYKKRYGLDDPLPTQYLKWLNHVSPVGAKEKGVGFPAQATFGFKTPDLGESQSRHRPVTALMMEALPITLLLQLISLPLFYGVGIWTGIRSARSRGKMVDIGLGVILLALFSMPEIWVGVLLIGFLTNQADYPMLAWFPSNGLHDVRAGSMLFLPHVINGVFQRGWLLDMIWHLFLPVLCMVYGHFAYLSRLQRGVMIDSLSQDYVRTARAKGLSEKVVIYRHAFRNSMISLITVAASILPALISGSIVVEYIFGIAGMGRLMVEAVQSRDRELLLSLLLVVGALQLFGHFFADLAYAVADPRVSYAD